MTDFNFLRIKWPKLAAIAADATRLVEVSPSSAISTMQNFCEWAADIALDFYDIDAQNGITQQEKLETLKATGHVPSDILARFNDIMLAGGRRLYRANEDVDEARRCLDDIHEVGRWLNKEAERTGWPPKNEFYRPAVTPLGAPGQEGAGGGAYSAGGGLLANRKALLLAAGGAVVVIIVAVIVISSFLGGGSKGVNGGKSTPVTLTQSPSEEPTFQILTATPEPTPTPAAEQVVFLDSLKPTQTKQSFFLKQWKFASGTVKFAIGDKPYENGIGMYIPSSSISKKQGTWQMSFKLGDTYDKLRFDLGADSNPKWYKAGIGTYRIQIYSNSSSGDPVYDTGGLKEYTYTDMGVERNITGCKTLIIKITEQKGTKGTINVVLGDIRVVKSGTGQASSTGSASPTGTGDGAGGTASAPPSPTASGKTTASAKATATK